MRNPIEDNSVQATMILPLWGRATYSRVYPEFLKDPKSYTVLELMLKDFDYDLSLVEKHYNKRQEYYQLVFCARARNMDDALESYLKDHPHATVVNIGAGMDTGFYRNDNGKLTWLDLDLPNVIELREKYLPGGDRHKNISSDVLDFEWLEKIPFNEEQGVFFIAGGFFLYFEESQVKDIITTLASRFPGGEIIFDGSSKLGLKITNSRTKKLGKTEMLWKFAIHKNPSKQFEPWSSKINVKDAYSYWERTKRNPKWNKTSRKMMKLSSILKMGKFVHLHFVL